MTPPCKPEPEIEKCKYSEEAADRAVKKVFAIFGVDVDDPKQVADFQQDIIFGRKARAMADRGLFVVIGAIALGITYAAYRGIISAMRGTP